MSGRLRCLALPAVALLGIAISGCAGNRELAEQAQQELVGRSTTEIFACAGAPGREIIKSKQNQEVSFFARRDASGFMITSNLGPQTKKGVSAFVRPCSRCLPALCKKYAMSMPTARWWTTHDTAPWSSGTV